MRGLSAFALAAAALGMSSGLMASGDQDRGSDPVSYTHLTLPTIYSV